MKVDRLPTMGAVSRFVSEPQGESLNQSGLIPIGTKALILTDQIASKTAGGIELPAQKVEELTLAVTRGALVAIGEGAFSDWVAGRFPKVGERVFLAKYAGIVIDGKDGKKYRLVQDVEIAGIEV